MTADQETAIIARVLDGDVNAFEALVLDNQSKVYALALRMTGSESDAMDISQDVFIKAYTGLKSFRGESRFSVWLYRMTYNLSADRLRYAKRNATLPLYIQGDDGDTRELDIADESGTPEDALLARETRDDIRRGLDALTPKHREVLILRESMGLGYAEIAKILRVSEGTVKSRIARARASLCDFLRKRGTFPNGARLNIDNEKEV